MIFCLKAIHVNFEIYNFMRNISKFLLLCAIFLFACAHVRAQEAEYHLGDSLTVFFRQGVDTFEPDYKQNERRCREFVERLEKLQASEHSRIAKIQIYSSASPEGSRAVNEKLAVNRAKSVTSYLHDALSFQDSIVFIHAIVEDWETLATMVEADNSVPSKDEALAIINDSSDPERKSHLMKLKGGRTWNYLYRKYFPLLRTFRLAVYVAPLHDKVEAKVPSIASTIPHKFELQNLPYIPSTYDPQPQWTRQITLKTNMLGWALMGENIAAEFDIIPHLSVAVPFYYSGGLDYFTETIKFRGIVLQPEVRWYPWLSEQKTNDGFFVGAHFGLGWYNFALNGDYRIQDKDGNTPSYGGGVSVGYAMQFKKKPRWGMEFALGGGVYKSTYDMFFNEANGPIYSEDNQKIWFGVDNAAVSFTYKFDVKQKGGRK